MMKISFVIPSTNPVGGVVKLYDYINHTKKLGYKFEIFCRDAPNKNSPIFQNSAYSVYKNYDYKNLESLDIKNTDYVFFSWPLDFKHIQKSIRHSSEYSKLIHIIQGVHHASPLFINGFALKLLSYPMNRIIIGEIAYDNIKNYLSIYGTNTVINLGHNLRKFKYQRSHAIDQKDVINVAYTTWKSNIGKKIEERFASNNGYAFRSIRKQASLEELKDLYQWADVFLATPLAKEGTYMPGLEALAAGCYLITPDVCGNMIYVTGNPLVVEVEYNDIDGYADMLMNIKEKVIKTPQKEEVIEKLVRKFSLEKEQLDYHKFIKIINV